MTDASYYEVEVVLLQYNQIFVFQKKKDMIWEVAQNNIFSVLVVIWTSYWYDGVMKGICTGGYVVPNEGW